MTLPASIRVNARVSFPTRVQGAAFITVNKANGIFTLVPDYRLLAPSGGVSPTQILAAFDTASGTWSYITSGQLGAILSNYRPVTLPGTVTIVNSDIGIIFQKAPSGASTIQLPPSSSRGGLPVWAKDLTYDANSNNITFAPAFGETLDGFSASAAIANGIALIDVDGGSKTFYPLTSGGWYIRPGGDV